MVLGIFSSSNPILATSDNFPSSEFMGDDQAGTVNWFMINTDIAAITKFQCLINTNQYPKQLDK
jgi:hypothetical protein